MTSTLDCVLRYLTYGWQPIPVHYAVTGVCSCPQGRTCHTPGKHPVPSAWQLTTFDEAQLRRYWEENKDLNVGLVTGARTNLVALDIDARHNGYESLQELEDRHGLLPKTTTSSTGGGGRHYLFQYPKDLFIPNKVNLYPGLDIRGDRGQIVAPPSYHDIGKRRYTWMAGLSPDGIMPVAMPPWLLSLLHAQEPIWIASNQVGEETAEVYYSGSRNNSLFRMGCRLRVIKDLTSEELVVMLHALNQSKCRPCLEDGEVDTIISSVLKKDSRHVVIPKAMGGPEPTKIKVLSTTSLWSEEEAVIPYIIPNLLSEGEVCLLASPTEAGKSLIAMSLALSVAAGRPAWGRGEPCKAGRVMYCTEELAGRTIRRRFSKLRRGLGITKDEITDENLCVIPQQNLSLALRNPAGIDALLLKAQQFKPTLVILDTFVSYFGAPEKDSDANRAWFGAVPIALRAAHNCGVIVQHHTRKLGKDDEGKTIRYGNMSDHELNNEIRGTSDLAGVAERIWFIWKKSEERNDFGPKVCVNFRNTKAREGDKHDAIQLIIQDPDEKTTTIDCAIGIKSKKHQEIEAKLRSVLRSGEQAKITELIKRLAALGISERAGYRWLATFVDERIVLIGANGEYSLNPSPILMAL